MIEIVIKYPNGNQIRDVVHDEILGATQNGSIIRAMFFKETEEFESVVINSEDPYGSDPYLGEMIDHKRMVKEYTPYNGKITIELYENNDK